MDVSIYIFNGSEFHFYYTKLKEQVLIYSYASY